MLHIHLICLWLHLLFRDNNVFKIIIYFRNRSTLLLSSDTPEECIRALTDGCEPPWGCWELNSGPLEQQSVLLTTEPSLQLQLWILLKVFFLGCHEGSAGKSTYLPNLSSLSLIPETHLVEGENRLLHAVALIVRMQKLIQILKVHLKTAHVLFMFEINYLNSAALRSS